MVTVMLARQLLFVLALTTSVVLLRGKIYNNFVFFYNHLSPKDLRYLLWNGPVGSRDGHPTWLEMMASTTSVSRKPLLRPSEARPAPAA